VGHGPSLLQKTQGKEIDAHDIVIRQKRSERLTQHYPEIYGTKIDALCCSWKLVDYITEYEAPEYWAFIDSRFENLEDAEIESAIKRFSDDNLVLKVDRALCDEWNETYRGMRTPFSLFPQMVSSPSSDALGHRHMSAGLHTLLYAVKFLKPDEVTLAGYDNVISGTWTWSVARGESWAKYPDHRFDVEHQMLPLISDSFNVEISPL